MSRMLVVLVLMMVSLGRKAVSDAPATSSTTKTRLAGLKQEVMRSFQSPSRYPLVKRRSSAATLSALVGPGFRLKQAWDDHVSSGTFAGIGEVF